MGRTVKNRKVTHPKPVEKVEVPSFSKRRLIFAVLFLLIGAAALSYGFNSLFSTEPGWAEIAANSGEHPSCAGDFTFFYELRGNGWSASSQQKAIAAVYTRSAEQCFQLFSNDAVFDGVHNVRYINEHPNEIVSLDAPLYRALEQVVQSDTRYLYLAPIYCLYDNLFYCQDDALTADFDPLINQELKSFFAETAEYACDPAQVNLELLGSGQVRLFVSDEYLAYAQDEEIDGFIDFAFMKNAFIIDALAADLTENGYTRGVLSSFDGFARALDADSGHVYALNLMDGQHGSARVAATMQYTGARAIVSLRSYPLNQQDRERFYVYENGQIRSAYLDTSDGLPRTSLQDFTVYAKSMDCATLLLRAAPLFIADVFREDSLSALAEAGIEAIYCQGQDIRYTEEGIALTDLYDGYTASHIEFQ